MLEEDKISELLLVVEWNGGWERASENESERET